MRSFSKKLAFVLAAAMVFTAFAPAAKAEAADMKINKSSKILYVTDGEGINDAAQVGGGKGNVAEYDFSVSNKPKDYKTTHTFKWSSSDEDVIEVGKAGLTKAVGVGVADVVCVVTEKATGIEKTLKSTVTVKANAAEVVITNADDYDGKAVNVGETVDLNRAMYDANGTKAPKRGVVVTDYTRWMVSPEAGVKIDPSNGKYTFTEDAKAGDYTLWCETYQSSKYTKATAVSDEIVVTLVAEENSFTTTQKSLTSFDIEFDAAVESLAKTDVTVQKVTVRNGREYYSKMQVKDVTLNTAKDTATVTLFASMADAVNYKITVADIEEPYVMAASVGLPEYIVVTAQVDGKDVDPLTTNKEATLVCKFYDANDVDVTAAGNYTANYSLEKYSTNGGYTLTGKNLKIKKAGEVVGVKAKYQKYDAGKLVVDINDTFYFTAEDPTPIYVTGIAGFSLNDFGDTNKEDLQVGEKSKYTLSVKVVTDDGADPIVKKADGVKIEKAVGTPTITFTAVNPEICNITSDGKLVPYKTGYAEFYVNTVSYTNGKAGAAEPIESIIIEVKENSKFDDFTLDKYSVNVGSVPGYDTETIKVTLYDQYDGKYSKNDELINVSGVSDNAKVVIEKNKLGVPTAAAAEQNITVKGSDIVDALTDTAYEIAAGDSATLDFKVKAGSIEQYFSVTVQVAGDPENNYVAVECDETTVDAVRTSDKDETKAAKSITFTVYQWNNGVKVNTQTLVGTVPSDLSSVSAGTYYYKLTKDGNALTDAPTDLVTSNGDGVTIQLSGTTPAASGSAITGGTVNYDKTGAGTYVFELYYSNADGTLDQIGAATSVVSVGSAGSYSVAKQVSNEVTLTSDWSIANDGFSQTDASKIVACFEFNGRDGKKTSNTKYDVKYDATNGTGSVFVESVTFYEEVKTGEYVAYNVPVNVVLVRK